MTPATKPLGRWRSDGSTPTAFPAEASAILGDLRSTVSVVAGESGPAAARGGSGSFGSQHTGTHDLLALLPPLPPARLGGTGFASDHGLKYPYMTGAMANGIASAEIVEAMCWAGMLGSFGAAG